MLSTAITALNVADAKAMIDAIVANRLSNQVLISPNYTDPLGLYIFDDNSSNGNRPSFAWADDQLGTLLNADSSANTTYNAGTTSGNRADAVHSGSGIAGLLNWGFYGFSGEKCWVTEGSPDGFVATSSPWWALHTLNSFSGQRAGNHTNGETTQDDFTLYLSANAFGGSSYSACPVLLATSAEEPFEPAFNGNFLAAWDSGFIGIECGWAGRVTSTTQLIGDPYIAYYALTPRVVDSLSATLQVGPGIGASVSLGG